MGRLLAAVLAGSLAAIPGCSIGQVPEDAPDPVSAEPVTETNAEEVFEDGLRRVSTYPGNGPTVYRPWRMGPGEKILVGIWKESRRDGPDGPWVRIPLHHIRKVDLDPWSGTQEKLWLLTLHGTFSFGHGDFVYGTLPDPESVFCPDARAARRLKEAIDLLRVRTIGGCGNK